MFIYLVLLYFGLIPYTVTYAMKPNYYKAFMSKVTLVKIKSSILKVRLSLRNQILNLFWMK